MITRGAKAYASAKLTYNERFDRTEPLAIVLPLSVEDVRNTVIWSRRTGIPLAIRSGGHSYAGYSTTTGVVVDLRHLNHIGINGATGEATIGAGARLIDVEVVLATRGRAIPTGSCPTVGIGGLASGGGVGFASRKFGTTSDNIVSIGIVTADGRYRICNARENTDLFWACRGGGGGNFGVITHFSFRTHPVSSVSYFVAGWPWQQAPEVVRAWQELAPQVPDELFSVCALRTGTTQPTIQSFGQFFGTEAELRVILNPLSRVAGGRMTIGSSSYLDAQLRWSGCLGKTVTQCHLVGTTPEGTLRRAKFRAKSDYVNAPFSPAAVTNVIRWIDRAQAQLFGSAALILDSYGGAINRVPAEATAFVHRDALFSGQYLAYWNEPSGAAPAAAWIRGFHSSMRPYVSGLAYQNYIDPELANWKHAYYGSNYSRLQAVKAAVDPDALFRFPQAIVAR